MNNALDPIIRRIASRSAARQGRVAVAIHPKTGKLVPDDTLLGMATRALMNDIVWYEVTFDEAHRLDNEKAPIEVFFTNERATISYRIRLRARRDKAEAIAQALHHTELTPLQVLFKGIDTYTERLLEKPDNLGPESVAERIAVNGPLWQAELERFVADRFYLDAEIIFDQKETIIETDIKLRVEGIPVVPADAPHASFPLTVSVTMARAAAHSSSQLPRSKEDRERLIANVVLKAFRDRLTLYNYWFEPHQVQAELANALSDTLVRFAYSVKRLSVDPVVAPITAEEQIYDEVSWTGRLNRPIPFHIETKIRLTPQGAGVYHARKLENRKEWIKKEVQAALKAAMYGRDFINLTPDVENAVRAKVEELLKAQASTIGHDVQTFVAKAAIPEQTWLSPTPVKVGLRTYDTKNPMVPAEFEIDLVIQLTRLERLESVIQAHGRNRVNDLQDGANDAIRAAIIASAVGAAAREMSRIQPEDYFFKFENWTEGWEKEAEKAKPEVASQLTRAIQQQLKSDFDIAACKVGLRRVDSLVQEIIRRVHRIGDITIELPIEPQHSTGSHHTIQVTITYSIRTFVPNRVHEIIQRGDAALNSDLIRKDLGNWSRETLRERTEDELYGLSVQRQDHKQVRMSVETYIDNLMVENHGVTIRIKSTDFKWSKEHEVGRGEASLPTEVRAAQLAKYRKAIAELTIVDDESRSAFMRERRLQLQKLIIENPRKKDEDFENLDRHERELQKIDADLVKVHGIATTRIPQLGKRDGAAEPPSTGGDGGSDDPPEPPQL